MNIVRRLLSLFIALALLAVAPVPAQDVTLISLTTGHSTILNTPGLTRVAVGDGKIAGVVPIGTSQVVINAKSPGHTTIFIWAADQRATYEVTVTQQTLGDLSQMFRQTIDEPGVQVAVYNRSILIKGTVSDEARLERLRELVSRFSQVSKDEKYNVVNAVTVAHPMAALKTDLSRLPGGSNVHVDVDAKGNVIVSGRVHDRQEAENVLEQVRAQSGSYLAADGKVIDRISVATATQIDVKVYVLEIDDTGLTQLGVRLQGGTPDANNPNKIILGDPSFPVFEDFKSAIPGVGRALNVGAFFRTTKLTPTLDLILRTGHGRILSAPNLVTSPGSAAKFLVGGEVPYAVSTGLGQVSIVFKEYGVKLDMTPTILGNGAIATKIAPEVSDLDFQNGITLNGFIVPALKTSRLSTDVITRSGESVIMGGLLRRVEQRNIDKTPILGDLPILGKLFRSTRYQKSETDVVFVMTPEIITR